MVFRGAEPVLGDADEIQRNQMAPLVQQLEEAVLAIGAGLTQTMGPVALAAASPDKRTDLPLLSISSCCK